jgi:hypothetical protein
MLLLEMLLLLGYRFNSQYFKNVKYEAYQPHFGSVGWVGHLTAGGRFVDSIYAAVRKEP